MAIKVSQAFERTSSAGIDSTFTLTKAQMLTVNDNMMPDKYFTICQDDGCIYLYDKSATASVTTGKFTKFEGGSGLDTIVNGYFNPTDNLFYEESTYTTQITGDIKCLYVSIDTDKTYRFDGTIFVRLDYETGQIIQVDTIPTASSSEEGKIYQYIGASVAGSYTHGYFYECVSDGAVTPTYSWEAISVQEGGSGQTIQVTTLPSPSATEEGKIYQFVGITSGSTINGYFYECIEDPDNVGTYIWVQKDIQPDEDTKIQVSTMPVVTSADEGSIVQFIGTTDPNYTNGFFYECVEDPDTAGTFVWVQKNTQPAGGSSIQVTTMPTATSADVDKVVQYIGVTDSTYTNGFFYKCVDNSGVYSWEQLNVQPEGAVVSSGTMLYATLEAASWSNKSQTVAIPGLIADDAGAIGLLETATAAQVEAARNAIITPTTLVDGYVTFTCENVPDIDIPFGVLIGGAGAGLTSSVTANVTVGAITSGTTLPQGLSFTDFVKRLLIAEVAPTIGFSITKSGYVTYGDSYTETLTLSVSNMGSAKKIKTIAWYEGNTLLQTDTVDSTATGSWTYTMSTATVDTTTFKAIVTYTKSDDVDTTATKTSTITFCYNKFYGVVSDLNPTEATVEALSLDTTPNKGATYTFTATNGRFCYAYPKTSGALTSIKDGNGFSLLDSFTRTEQSYTQNGTTVVYYRYVLTDATTVSNYKVTFA